MRTLAVGLALLIAASGCSLVNDPGELEPGPDTTIPPTPGGLEAIPGKTWATLQWDPVDVADFDGYVVFAGTISGALSSAGQTMDPSFVVTALSDGLPYYFSVVTVDRAGNVSDFAAEASATPDDTPPSVAFSPGAGATGVNTTASVVLTFDEPMNRQSVQAGAVTITGPGTVPPCAWSWDTGDQIAVCDFVQDLTTSTTYTASVGAGATDRAGNAIVPTSASFTTTTGPDVTPPTIASSSPAGASGTTAVYPEANIAVTFDEAMDQASVTTSTFQIVSVSVGNVVDHRNGLFTWSNGGKTVTYDPPVNFANGALVTYRIEAGVKDLAGNAMGTASTRSFTVARQATVAIEGDPALDGYGAFDGGSVAMHTTYTTMYVGDDSGNRHFRSWVGFPHGALASATRILAATMSVYQTGCVGSPYTALDQSRWWWLPSYKCSDLLQDCDKDLLAQHVNPGVLGSEDFDAAPLAYGPELAETPDDGWVSRSVTSYVQADRAAAPPRGMTQFRLEFPVTTDGQGTDDYCVFYTSNDATHKPRLVVTYEYP